MRVTLEAILRTIAKLSILPICSMYTFVEQERNLQLGEVRCPTCKNGAHGARRPLPIIKHQSAHTARTLETRPNLNRSNEIQITFCLCIDWIACGCRIYSSLSFFSLSRPISHHMRCSYMVTLFDSQPTWPVHFSAHNDSRELLRVGDIIRIHTVCAFELIKNQHMIFGLNRMPPRSNILYIFSTQFLFRYKLRATPASLTLGRGQMMEKDILSWIKD
jgi:hypothetical protein